jgi:hypothetical protein
MVKKKRRYCNGRKQRQAASEVVSPSRQWPHKFIIVVSIATTISALNMGLGQFLGIVFEQVGPVQYVLRVYVFLLCILVVFNELEWTKLMRDSKIMSIWIGSLLLIYWCLGTGGERYIIESKLK